MKLIINTDGGARGNPGPSASAFVIKDNEGQTIHTEHHYLGHTTNNVAEYTAVIKALEFLSTREDKDQLELQFYLDSNLVVQQLNGVFKIKQEHLKPLAATIHTFLRGFLKVTFSYVPRAQNSEADALVNTCLDANTV